MFNKIFYFSVCLSGLALCVVNWMGGGIMCLTEGCSVYASYSFLGLSFYAWGGAAFLLCLVSGIFGTGAFSPRTVTGTLLAADIPFLAWQAVFMPCSSCLTVTLVILAAYLSASRTWSDEREKPDGRGGRLLVVAIVVLVFVNGFSVAREMVGPWAVYGDPDTAEYEIYFSLECPSCRETMGKILGTPGMKDKVVLYPVAKSDGDRDKFGTLYCGLKNGHDLPAALDRSWGVKECEHASVGLSFVETVMLRIRLLWNKALLVRKGYSRVPVLVSSKLIVVPGECGISGGDQAWPAETGFGWSSGQVAGSGCRADPGDVATGCSIE